MATSKYVKKIDLPEPTEETVAEEASRSGRYYSALTGFRYKGGIVPAGTVVTADDDAYLAQPHLFEDLASRVRTTTR
jgi:hypothetical protein